MINTCLTTPDSSLQFAPEPDFRWIAPLVGRLSKLGPPGKIAAALLTRLAGTGRHCRAAQGLGAADQARAPTSGADERETGGGRRAAASGDR